MSFTESEVATPRNVKKDIILSIKYPLIFVAALWIIKLVEIYFEISFKTFGVFPRHTSGLAGIIFSPLIHGDLSHLMSNTFPVIILGSMLVYFYKSLAPEVYLLGWIISGFWLWILGREAYHIGASGLIYCMASFLFVSGILRRHRGLMAVSLVVTFLYGGIIWGVFPIKEQMSWEGHLTGLVAGFVLAFFYKKKGPQRKLYSWELEDEDDEFEKFEEYYKDYLERKKNSKDDSKDEEPPPFKYTYKEKDD